VSATVVDRAVDAAPSAHRIWRAGPWGWLLVTSVVVGTALRLWHIADTRFIWDETFTGWVARLPFKQMLDFLRHHDAHPPLDYLIHVPIARHTAAEWPMRLPSVLASVAALVLFASWMRRYARTGAIATALLALAAFQITYAPQARMYGVLVLLGVGAAVISDRWLDAPRARHAPAVGILVFVGLLVHLSTGVLAVGLAAVPGHRRDREAWRWRGWIIGAVLLWLAVWLPSLLDQVRAGTTSWVPLTSGPWLARSVNELVDFYVPVGAFVLAATLLGGFVLRRIDRRLAWVWLCCFAIPLGIAATVGLRAHFLQPRTLAIVSWGPMLALAALVEMAARRWIAYGVAGAVLLALLVVPSVRNAIADPEAGRHPAWASVELRLQRAVEDGDGVVSWPRYLRPPTQWYVADPSRQRTLSVPGLVGDGFVRGARPWNGRVWLVEPADQAQPIGSWRPCAPTFVADSYQVRCVERGSS